MIFVFITRFVLGYVKFKIISDIPERLINQLSINKIGVWNTVRNGNTLEAYILAKDYKKMYKIKGKNKVKTKVIKKYGLPFLVKKYSKRVGILIGIILFVIIINFLSSRVWYVKVQGNEYISTKQILSIAEKSGLKIGAKKKNLNSVELKNDLFKNIKNVSWIAVNIEGSRVTLEISENLKVPKKEKTYPSNLVANKNGVITKLLVKEGVTAVRVNQAVQKGDLLVSGTVEYKNGNSEFKHSLGEIFAKTERKIVVTQNYKEKVSEFTGEIRRKNVLSFFGINVPMYIGNINEKYQKEVSIKQYKNENMALPVFFYSAKFLIKKEKYVKYSKEQAEKLAEIKMNEKENKLLKNIDNNLKEEKIIKNNNSVKIVRIYECIENIAKEEKIKVNTTN